MTTFTKISAKKLASITINPEHTLFTINPLIYGGFTEHMGRCIYGGLYDPDNKFGLADENGFRTDVIECMRELGVPVVRYPGGNFNATYHWLDGVGPREQRPKRIELAWSGIESNQFGTDEFMLWCTKVMTEPYLALNMGTGTLDEALAWLEYCNSDRDTYYANLRRQNGHEKPYNVKYWALGNEVWGPWQVEQATKEDYAKKAVQWGRALKRVDPNIKLILCGKDGVSDWDRYVLQQCLEVTDMHSIHIYTAANEYYANVTAPKAAERAIEITASLIDLARCEVDHRMWPKFDTRPKTDRRPTICLDEWNVWDYNRAPGDVGAEEKYNVSDMLAVVLWLNVLIRQAKYLGMANIAQSVNVISPLMTTDSGVVKQTTWWPLLLFTKYMRGQTLSSHVQSTAYTGKTMPEYLETTLDLPMLDVSATLNDDGHVNVAVVNISKTEWMEVRFEVDADDVLVFTVGGAANEISDSNNSEEEKVNVRQSSWNGKGNFVFEPHSFTMLRWKPNGVEHIRVADLPNSTADMRWRETNELVVNGNSRQVAAHINEN